MDHPETEIVEGGEESSIHLSRVVPIYPLTEGLPQRWLRSIIWHTLELYETKIEEPWSRESFAIFLPSRAEAIRTLHFPEAVEDAARARRRLPLHAFVELQRQILARRRNFETKAQALPCEGDKRFINPCLARLGVKLTEAQT